MCVSPVGASKAPLTASEPGMDCPVFRPGDWEAQKEGVEMHPDLSVGVSHLVALAPQPSPILTPWGNRAQLPPLPGT